MGNWKGKTRGGKIGHEIFIFLIKHFNIRIAYFVLRFVALYFIFFSPSSFKSLLFFYNKQLRFGFFKSIKYIYKNYYKFGQTLLDKVALMSGSYSKFTFDFSDEVFLDSLIEKRTGGLLISAHVGSWEISAQLLNRFGNIFNVVIIDAEHKKIKELLEKIEVNKKFKIILIKDDLSHIYQINEALSNNEFICIHGDRYIPKSRTISHNFFNEPAKFPYGVFYLAVRYHVPVTFVFSIKTSSKHYKFFATAPKYFNATTDKISTDEKIKIVLDEYVENLECMVSKYPEHWFNYFYFWDGAK